MSKKLTKDFYNSLPLGTLVFLENDNNGYMVLGEQQLLLLTESDAVKVNVDSTKLVSRYALPSDIGFNILDYEEPQEESHIFVGVLPEHPKDGDIFYPTSVEGNGITYNEMIEDWIPLTKQEDTKKAYVSQDSDDYHGDDSDEWSGDEKAEATDILRKFLEALENLE